MVQKMKSYGAGMKVTPGKDNAWAKAAGKAGELGKKYSFLNKIGKR